MADELYRIEPEDFVARRNVLARQLRTDGRREEAAAVAKLRRPTVAAWAVNQAVRADPDAFQQLLEAGAALQQALRRAVSGVKDADVRGAGRARRDQVNRLTQQALTVLSEAGRDPSAHRDDIAATFEAASADPEAAAQVGAGRLSQPLPAPTGFGELAPLGVVAEPPAHQEPGSEPASEEPAPAAEEAPPEPTEAPAEPGPDPAAVHRAERARERAREASEDALDARKDAQEAAHDARDAEDEVARLVEEAERARRAAEQAQHRAERLRRRAERLERVASDAADLAERRRRELEEAEEALGRS